MHTDEPGSRRLFLKGALATPMIIASSSILAPETAHAHATAIRPSTTVEPYLVPSIAGAKLVSLLTTGDSVNGYRMVGGSPMDRVPSAAGTKNLPCS